MRRSSPVCLSILVSPAFNVLVFGEAIRSSTFSQRCSDLCSAFVLDATLSTSCQQICDALQVQEEEPCIQALTNTSEEQLTLMSYSSGHFVETASILAHVAQEANPDYLWFVEHLRLHDRGSPQACHSLDDAHYCLVRDPSMSLGLCLPDMCNSASVTDILANISIASRDSAGAMVDNHVIGLGAPPTDQPSFAVVCGEESRLDADAGTILALLLVCFLFSLTVAGTLLDFRKEARVIARLQKHPLRLSGEDADQQGSSDLLRDTVEDKALVANLETPIGEHESGGTTVGNVRSSGHGGVGAPRSNESALREPLLDSSGPSGNLSEHGPSWWIQCLLCFSLLKNMKKLLAPPSSSNTFGALDGVRTLSNLWVIMLHVCASALSASGGGLTNTVDVIALNGHGALSRKTLGIFGSNGVLTLRVDPDLWPTSEDTVLSPCEGTQLEPNEDGGREEDEVIPQGTLAVDTFFLMSGFLASVTLLPILPRVQPGSRNISSWVLGRYWHRYLRLMPTTAFVTLFSWQLFPLVSDGPAWWPYATTLKNNCRRDWWTEITFVQNLVPWPMRRLPCIVVAWSLGIEMQFFLGAVPLIALFHYHPRASVATLLSIMTTSSILTLWFAFYQDIRFPFFHMSFADPNSFEDWWEVYVSPWFRCPTYIIGVLGGMAWHTYCRGRNMSTAQRLEGQSTDDSWATIDRILVPVGFTTSALLMSLPVFGAYWANRDVMEVEIPMWQDHLYLAFSRPTFVSGVALVCGLCFCGRGGVVNWFLSLPMWSPLSRLTFCSYLIHLMLLSWLFTTRSVPFRYTTFEVIITFLGATGAAFISAAVVHLLVEAPFRNLESWARKRSARRAPRL